MKKNALRKKLMNDKVYNPFHRDYNLSQAMNDIQEMEKNNNIEKEELSIVLSSYLFNDYYKTAYDVLDYYIERTELTVRKLIEWFMAIPNRDHFISSQKSKFTEYKELNIRDINSLYVDVPIKGMEPANVRGLCEGGISTINIILNHIKYCQEKIKENKKEQMEDSEFKEILRAFRYTNLRYELKEAYDDVVWNQGTIMVQDSKMYLEFQDKDRLKVNCVGDWRGNKLISEVVPVYYDMLKRIPEMQITVLYPNRRFFVSDVKEENGYIKCCLDENLRDIEENSLGIIHRAEVDIFYPYVVDIKFEKLNGLDLNGIITLYSILNEIIVKLEKNKSIEDDINSFGYKITRKDLVRCLKCASTFSKKQIQAFIELVSFDFATDEGRIDLYKKPIILYKDVYYLNSLLLQAPNTLVMIDEWLREVGYDLKERGTTFEKYLKDKVSKELKLKRISHQVINKSKFYRDKNKYEEIDLIIEMERIIIVGEVKCITYPLEPRDYHNMYKTLDKATKQVREKANFLEKNKKIFKDEIQGLGDKEIIEVVITNYPLYTGHSINDVPIIDNITLEKYIGMGEMRAYSMKYENDILQQNELYRKKFYNDKEEFYSNMRSYFKAPLVVSEPLKDVKIKNSLLVPKEVGIEIYKECAVMGEARVV